MITVEEALALVRGRVRSKPPVTVALADALGLVLAEDVASDVDSPPYDKSIVDGYAVVADDLREGGARLAILEEVIGRRRAAARPSFQARPRAS